jgi:hypothetical protein
MSKKFTIDHGFFASEAGNYLIRIEPQLLACNVQLAGLGVVVEGRKEAP